MNKYRCKHCGKIVLRDSNKAWIKSYCEKTGKNVHLLNNAVILTYFVLGLLLGLYIGICMAKAEYERGYTNGIETATFDLTKQ